MPRNGRLFPFGWYKLLTGMKSVKTGRLFTLGVIPEYRKRGVESLLCVETALRAKELGMSGGEIGWTLEDNDLINSPIQALGGKLDRVYRLYGVRG
jgi:ribosomal protein S18 acetylase RimI-like enzyme